MHAVRESNKQEREINAYKPLSVELHQLWLIFANAMQI